MTIYYLQNDANGKLYIGKTANDWHGRCARHVRELTNGDHYNQHLQRSYNRGDSFVSGSLYQADCPDELDFAEIMMIGLLETTVGDIGYNKTYGGDGVQLTEELISRRVETLRKTMERDDIRNKYRSVQVKRFESKDEREKHAAKVRKAFQDPEVRQRHKDAHGRPETRSLIGKAVRERWRSDGFRNDYLPRHKAAMNRPEVKEKISRKTKEVMSTPVMKEKVSKLTKEAMNRPEVRNRFLAAMRSDEVRRKISDSMRAVHRRKKMEKLNAA